MQVGTIRRRKNGQQGKKKWIVKKVVLLFSKEKGATGIFDGISAGSERVTWVEMKRRKKKMV